MAKDILDTFKKVVVPAWKDRQTPLQEFNEEFAERVIEVNHTTLDLKQLALEYRHWDRTATKNLI